MGKLSAVLQKRSVGRGRTVRAFSGLVTLLIVILCLDCDKFKKDIFIESPTIQGALDKKFPFEKNAVITRAILKNPEIYFQDSSLGIRMDYWANFLEKEVNGKMDLNGNIRYERGSFYLTNLEIVNFSMEEKSFNSNGKLSAAILNIIKNYIDGYPIYTLKQSDFKQNLAKMLLKRITIIGDSLCITIGI